MQQDFFGRDATSEGRQRAWFNLIYFGTLVFGMIIVASFVLVVMILTGKLLEPTAGIRIGMALVVVAALAAFALIRKQPASAFGFGRRHSARNFVIGLFAGIALVGGQLLGEHALGGYSFGGITASADALWKPALFGAAAYISVAIVEEGMWRGYALVQLSRAVSFWPAALILSVAFGSEHIANPGENWFGVSAAFLFGVALCLTFRFTGSLWLALGLHAGWDYAESFIFGVPDSGFVDKTVLLHPAVHGPAWLTGGSVGPEASVLVVAPLAGIVVLGWLLRDRTAAAVG